MRRPRQETDTDAVTGFGVSRSPRRDYVGACAKTPSVKPRPQTLKLLLLDGEPTGTWIAELDNWDVKALRIPRTRAKELAAARPELQHTGIYLLITRPDVHQDRVRVYIGESEDMAVRLRQHLDQKPDWNEVVVFTRKFNELNKAHVKYLEGLLHGKIAAANRYDLDNGNSPMK